MNGRRRSRLSCAPTISRRGWAGPAALVVHTSPTQYRLPFQPPLAWAFAEMNRFSHYIFNSAGLQSTWFTLGEIGRRPSFIIPNCCREDEVGRTLATDRRGQRQRLGWPEDRFIAVCVASLQYRKGQDLLVRALPRILGGVPNAQIVLAGATTQAADQHFGASLLEEARRGGLGDRIVLAGHREDSLDLIYAADLFVLPSRSEAMPLAILEAMALKTPVIASNIDGMRDLVVEGQTGRLFPCEEVEALTEAFIDLASNPLLRATLAQAARVRYWSHFSRKIVASKYVDAVSRLARGEAWS